MLIPLIIIAAAFIFVFFLVIARQPAEFRITRSATLPVPPDAVFPHVNDLHLWQVWSPWAKMDPNAKNTFTGAPEGNGASMAWAGNKKVGEGRMTITDSRPNEAVRLKLEFLKPFVATHVAEFTFKPQGGETLVTWSMSGTNNFMAKLFTTLMNCDKMIGGQFEQGLASLREVTGKK